MAKQRYGINDGYRGTVGTVIGYLWRGKWCLRARPRYVHNPRTARQISARGLFSGVSRLASRMQGALRLGMHSEALKLHRTVCNHFMSVNRQCFALEDNRLSVDYEHLTIALGPVAPVGFSVISEQCSVVSEATQDGRVSQLNTKHLTLNTITIPFEKNPLHLRADGDDQVYLYAWCPAHDKGLLSAPG